jgi:hypothetical protein
MLQAKKINLTVMARKRENLTLFSPSFVYLCFFFVFAGTGTNWSKFRKSPDASAVSKLKPGEGMKSVLCSLLLHPLQCISACSIV